ncbi:hypothetical protein EDEG_00958 [Edhazardia aedis USNM 41457]|uniref:Rad21/Rec8-like protein N-terminal domain-containing protein n=1 Tax=Edhazardia aedis (strain USNM 41457) TaxID=1003232 RepID=J9DQM5_EDHAE|nr:hypothetical protein EDEG_00958 [Edhazardia aedis USNM 41457]|eukprot:EJW04865.1 hypothetical protein EDEG_00958 [Edhazardia aedis USNM 41457]
MFYSTEILSIKNKTSLALIYYISTTNNRTKKITKKDILTIDLPNVINALKNPSQPFALRLYSILIKGVVRIYFLKVKYLEDEISVFNKKTLLLTNNKIERKKLKALPVNLNSNINENKSPFNLVNNQFDFFDFDSKVSDFFNEDALSSGSPVNFNDTPIDNLEFGNIDENNFIEPVFNTNNSFLCNIECLNDALISNGHVNPINNNSGSNSSGRYLNNQNTPFCEKKVLYKNLENVPESYLNDVNILEFTDGLDLYQNMPDHEHKNKSINAKKEDIFEKNAKKAKKMFDNTLELTNIELYTKNGVVNIFKNYNSCYKITDFNQNIIDLKKNAISFTQTFELNLMNNTKTHSNINTKKKNNEELLKPCFLLTKLNKLFLELSKSSKKIKRNTLKETKNSQIEIFRNGSSLQNITGITNITTDSNSIENLRKDSSSTTYTPNVFPELFDDFCNNSFSSNSFKFDLHNEIKDNHSFNFNKKIQNISSIEKVGALLELLGFLTNKIIKVEQNRPYGNIIIQKYNLNVI